MRQGEQRISKMIRRFRGRCPELRRGVSAPRKNSSFVTALLTVTFCAICLIGGVGRLYAEDPKGLTEVEALKGENLQLRYDSLDKQLRLMEFQYGQLREMQAQTIRDLQQLEQEILKARDLKPGEWAVNWPAKKAQPVPQSEPPFDRLRAPRETEGRPSGSGPAQSEEKK